MHAYEDISAMVEARTNPRITGNRLRTIQRVAEGDTTTIGTYAYWPDNRRASKTVEHCGSEAVANDCGDTVVYFYYGGGAGVSPARWNVLETRNGSHQATRQWVWGQGGMGVSPVGYVDELLFMDVNGSPATSNTCDPDDPNKAAGTRRYFYHQDRNWNVVALSEYGSDGVGTNGRLAERYAYTPYGEFVVLKGDGGSGELGRVLPASSVGNVFFHQGLPVDPEKGSYQNRHRDYQARLQRFAECDPLLRTSLGPRAAKEMSLYNYVNSLPVSNIDSEGLMCCSGIFGKACCSEHSYLMSPPNQSTWALQSGLSVSNGAKCKCTWRNARTCDYQCECKVGNAKGQFISCSEVNLGSDTEVRTIPQSTGNCGNDCANWGSGNLPTPTPAGAADCP